MTPTQTLIAGIIMLALIVPLALKRVAFLVKWITDGQPAPDRWDDTVEHLYVRPDAQRRLYRLSPEPLLEIDEWLAPYRRLWERSLDRLERHLEENP